MDCQLVKDNLLDYAGGNISAELESAIKAHLDSCAGCRNYARVVFDFNRIISDEKALKVNPFLITRIEEKIKTLEKPDRSAFPVRFIRAYYYYAAVVVLALSIGVFTGKQLGSLLNKNEAGIVITPESEQLKKDFFLNEIEKDDVSQVLNNQ